MSKKRKPQGFIGRPPDAAVKPVFERDAPGPAFSFKHLCIDRHSASHCSYEQLRSLMDKLRILSALDWKVISSSPRTTNGYEELPEKVIRREIPSAANAKGKIMIFRFGSGASGGRIAGVREGHRFNVLFIDSKFDLYEH